MAKEIFEKKNYEVRVTHVDKGYEVEKELENNLWADIIFIQTPIYWFNIPGKFKSYIDKIYTIGNAGSMSNGDGRTRNDLSKKYGLNVHIVNGENNKSDSLKKMLDDFRSKDGFNIIILSTLAAGVGLTLNEANHVIHYERHWNPAKEDQASDRVYRIGQTKDVFI